MPGATLRFSFIAKLIAALLAVAIVDLLWGAPRIGSWWGGLALAWVALLFATRPAVRRGLPLVALIGAALVGLALFDRPGPLGTLLGWALLSVATLLPRTAGFDDALRWGARLFVHAATGPFAPVVDFLRLTRTRRSVERRGVRGLLALLALPIAMGALFVALFAAANPLIARAFSDIHLPPFAEAMLWGCAIVAVWPSLRPRALTTAFVAGLPQPELTLPGASLPSVLISLLLFNGLFAVQNALDLAFLWSGAPLPDGVTLAAYAHQGAYPLIVTALLAGFFVLATLKPGSASAADPTIRRLVILWVAQNLLLVASSILRTLDYVEVYMLTAWRIAALIWMGLVALGLLLILWRMLEGRSARWLINANAAAALAVLFGSIAVDFDAVAATWNARHAREVGGRGVALDLCELQEMGSAALVPLAELERRRLDPAFRDRVVATREAIMAPGYDDPSLDGMQADWRGWIWRDARRLKQMRALLGPRPASSAPIPESAHRGCGGAIVLPEPLTGAARP